MEIKLKRSDEIIKTITVMKIKLPRSKASEIPKVTKLSNQIRIYLFIVGVCNKTYIPFIEPVQKLCNYHFITSIRHKLHLLVK